MTAVELEFLCDVCGGRIEDGAGCLEIRFGEIQAYREAKAEWERVHGTGTVHRIGELLTFPEAVPWRLYHDRCNPDPDAGGYDVDVSHVRTWRELLLWTSRLMAKNWLALTDWPQVIGAAAEGRSGRIKELAAGDAA